MAQNRENVVYFQDERLARTSEASDFERPERVSYIPASARQVEDIADMIRELGDELRHKGSPSASELSPPESTRGDLLKGKFEWLAGKWRTETAYCSTVLEMAMNPHYQQIIGMGERATPFILSELAKESGHWFWALKAITGEDPVPKDDKGDLRKMREAWLTWGARNGYNITPRA